MSTLQPSQRTLYERLGRVGRVHGRLAADFDKFKVPPVEQAELRAIVQSTYGDIVIAKA